MRVYGMSCATVRFGSRAAIGERPLLEEPSRCRRISTSRVGYCSWHRRPTIDTNVTKKIKVNVRDISCCHLVSAWPAL